MSDDIALVRGQLDYDFGDIDSALAALDRLEAALAQAELSADTAEGEAEYSEQRRCDQLAALTQAEAERDEWHLRYSEQVARDWESPTRTLFGWKATSEKEGHIDV